MCRGVSGARCGPLHPAAPPPQAENAPGWAGVRSARVSRVLRQRLESRPAGAACALHSELCLLVASGGNQLPCVEKSLLAVDDKFQRQKYWGQPATTSRETPEPPAAPGVEKPDPEAAR